jgi:hypothetical protein
MTNKITNCFELIATIARDEPVIADSMPSQMRSIAMRSVTGKYGDFVDGINLVSFPVFVGRLRLSIAYSDQQDQIDAGLVLLAAAEMSPEAFFLYRDESSVRLRVCDDHYVLRATVGSR